MFLTVLLREGNFNKVLWVPMKMCQEAISYNAIAL